VVLGPQQPFDEPRLMLVGDETGSRKAVGEERVGLEIATVITSYRDP
jgi:hypothetical protein